MTLSLSASARARLERCAFPPIEFMSEADVRQLPTNDLRSLCAVYSLKSTRILSEEDATVLLQLALDAHCDAHLGDRRDYARAAPISDDIPDPGARLTPTQMTPPLSLLCDAVALDASVSDSAGMTPAVGGIGAVDAGTNDPCVFMMEVAPGVMNPVAARGIAVGEGMLQLLQTSVVRELFDKLGDDFLFNQVCQGRGIKIDPSDRVSPEELETLARFMALEQSRQRIRL
jgi:hypothetical protein